MDEITKGHTLYRSTYIANRERVFSKDTVYDDDLRETLRISRGKNECIEIDFGEKKYRVNRKWKVNV